jgi:hypothetical protein
MPALLTHKDSLRNVSELFTSTTVNKIVRMNDSKGVLNRIKKNLTEYSKNTYQSIFTLLYEELNNKYRNEYVYKNNLFNDLILEKYCLSTTTVLNEFKIGSSIADFVLLNGEARIFEIKTDLDKLDKLDKQLADYCQFADRVYIVASSKHINKLKSLYSSSTVGIIELTNQNELLYVKDATSNIEVLNHTTIFKTLRRAEYLQIVYDFFGFIPEVPNTLVFKECLALLKKIDVKEFQTATFNILKGRKLNNSQFLKSDKTPYELRYICYTLNFTEDEYLSLYKFLNKTI